MANAVTIVLLCIVYMIIGPSIILLNKYILHEIEFPHPIFLSGLGVLFSGVTAQFLVRTGYVKLKRKEALQGISWIKHIFPVCVIYAVSLALGNTAYLFLTMGFIQMFKSFIPVLLMIVTYVAGVEIPSRGVVISVLIISFGTAATCSYTPELSLVGLAVVLTAESLEAVRLVMTQYLLQNLNLGVIEGLYYLAPISTACLFIASLIFEFKAMRDSQAHHIIFDNLLTFSVASMLGLVVNFLTYYVIQATSSLTMKILGGIRNIVTILLSVIYFNEVLELRSAIGYTIAFVGFLSYTAAKAGYLDSNHINTSSHHKSIGNGTNVTHGSNNTGDSSADQDDYVEPTVTTSLLQPSVVKNATE